MTRKLKAGRPKSPCKKCGGAKRNANGNCVPCYRLYMREYRKKWVAERKAEIAKRKADMETKPAPNWSWQKDEE